MYFTQLILCYTVFYAESGGATLDSHHGFIVECGLHRDVETGKSYGWLEFIYR
jgi:Ser-tRNA(Ala) deacylase AlaX